MISSGQVAVAVLLIIVLPLIKTNFICKSKDYANHSDLCECIFTACQNISGFKQQFWSSDFDSTDINCTSWREFCKNQDGLDALKDCQFKWEKDDYFNHRGDKSKA